MDGYFLDSSAVTKRYVAEAGTAWVTRLTDRSAGNIIFLAEIGTVEIVSALVRRGRGGSLSATQVAAALARFRGELPVLYRLIDVTPALVARAATLAEVHALRGYDAVQLASALEARAQFRTVGGPIALVSADAELNAAARSEGFAVEDPNQYP